MERNTDGVKVVPWVRPQECAATGAGHHDGPYGPKGQRQCHYCGQPPSDGVPASQPMTRAELLRRVARLSELYADDEGDRFNAECNALADALGVKEVPDAG